MGWIIPVSRASNLTPWCSFNPSWLPQPCYIIHLSSIDPQPHVPRGTRDDLNLVQGLAFHTNCRLALSAALAQCMSEKKTTYVVPHWIDACGSQGL
ncbi:hypothetical protein BaRGS_00010752 [Batillaria attramentaria]|uniref:BRCT domain-containing protein n=1 Tax=Batillaria attramentaria TaxID=370345 RepID=A0ABD0LFB4_9CAEN